MCYIFFHPHSSLCQIATSFLPISHSILRIWQMQLSQLTVRWNMTGWLPASEGCVRVSVCCFLVTSGSGCPKNSTVFSHHAHCIYDNRQARSEDMWECSCKAGFTGDDISCTSKCEPGLKFSFWLKQILHANTLNKMAPAELSVDVSSGRSLTRCITDARLKWCEFSRLANHWESFNLLMEIWRKLRTWFVFPCWPHFDCVAQIKAIY